MIEFKYHVSSELTSPGAFSFTIIISTLVMVCSIASIIGTKWLMAFLFPLTNLLYVVFSSAIFIITIYTNQHTYFASSLPIWTNYLLSGIAFFVLILAVLGYITYRNISSFLLTLYITINSIAAITFLVTGAGLLIVSEWDIDEIKREWPSINQKLLDSGY